MISFLLAPKHRTRVNYEQFASGLDGPMESTETQTKYPLVIEYKASTMFHDGTIAERNETTRG